MAETKIIYHMDEEETPYLVKLPVAPERVTLADFKNVLSNRPVHAYKFFFKSMDQDFGVVKEEISDDNARLPCFNGRVVSWLVLAEGAHSDAGSQSTDGHTELPPPLERTGGIGDSRPPSFHPNVASSRDGMDNETGTESLVSHRRERARRRNREEAARTNGHPRGDRRRDLGLPPDSASTVLSSELESSSFIDSDEDDNTSRLSSSTEQSTSSRLIRKHKRRRRKQRMRQADRASSFSSITDSTMSLNIITVTLNMERHHFLGISIVGQSNERGDGGIYIGSIMKGGAVAADGRIEPGDMLLQVNDINFENMSNDDAVRVLREIVSQTGPISLTVAKCWDPTPRSYFTIPRGPFLCAPVLHRALPSIRLSLHPLPRGGHAADPVRPIDPAAWLSHTAALTGALPRYELEEAPLTVKSDMGAVVRVMQLPDSGLEIRDRMWLKITIANAVIGADVVDWLYAHVEGFKERREARKYASSMLKRGFLRHTVNKITFSEQCYYVFGDLCSGSKSSGSTRSAGGSSRRALGREKERRAAGAGGSGSESDHTAPSGVGGSGWRERPASQLSRGSSPHSQASAAAPGLPPLYPLTKAYSVVGGPPGGPPVRELAAVPPELTGSRQSFQKAMGNPCEFFVDIM
ncbi:segment polarity protein dishevelled homolog DVL-1 isoform X4 [Ursus arctos]|uniref:segment polarity protein dishevelled homolog DVL-1 isoform X4 n=1 Tax=Ursus arctos TaxID=9644 RepID=UPI0025486B2E|nr:segment polarity protein dishevelled homolog DVL-1 isoform X4 [Ursus arctos]